MNNSEVSCDYTVQCWGGQFWSHCTALLWADIHCSALMWVLITLYDTVQLWGEFRSHCTALRSVVIKLYSSEQNCDHTIQLWGKYRSDVNWDHISQLWGELGLQCATLRWVLVSPRWLEYRIKLYDLWSECTAFMWVGITMYSSDFTDPEVAITCRILWSVFNCTVPVSCDNDWAAQTFA